jgi:hypothetical protein
MNSPHWFYRIVMPWVVGLGCVAGIWGTIVAWQNIPGPIGWIWGLIGVVLAGGLYPLLRGRIAFCSRSDAARMKAEGFDVTVPRLSFYGIYNPRELKNADSPTLVENSPEK